jgi:hypothetical protein
MDRAAMVTFLAESLLLPNAALQEYITWEAVDDMHAKATITYRGLSAEGVFTFDEEGRMCSFTTEDRASYQNDGSFEYVRWSAICENYQDQGGYLVPTTLKAVWHYTDGDLVYFDGRNAVVTYS